MLYFVGLCGVFFPQVSIALRRLPLEVGVYLTNFDSHPGPPQIDQGVVCVFFLRNMQVRLKSRGIYMRHKGLRSGSEDWPAILGSPNM